MVQTDETKIKTNWESMKREIKFRAWDEKSKCMFYSDKTDLGTFFDHVIWGLEPELMQFTGLRDKNGKGKEVYEGDYFKAIFKDCPDGFKIMGKDITVIEIKATVVFKFGKFCIEMMHPEYKELVYTPLFDFLKNEQKVVIGNIYENPELL